MPARQNKPWTEEDDRRLMEMRATGKSTFFMCAVLKRSAGGIKARIANLRARVKLGPPPSRVMWIRSDNRLER